MNGHQAREAIAQVLMDKVRDDPYPSTTHMELLEGILPDELLGEYLGVLVDKVAADRFPSTPMLQRIQRIAASI